MAGVGVWRSVVERRYVRACSGQRTGLRDLANLGHGIKELLDYGVVFEVLLLGRSLFRCLD